METEQANLKSHINLKVLLSILGAVVVIATFALLIHKPSPAIDPTGSAINKSEIIKNEKFLSGNILSVTPAAGSGSGVITIRANILDVSTKEDFIQKSDRIFIEQEFSVKYDNSTSFEEKAVGGLAAGDIVQVYTDGSIYLSKNLAAERVVFYDEQAIAKRQIIGNTHMVSGIVQSATGTEIMVSAEIVDKLELDKMELSDASMVPMMSKEFRVIYNDGTEVFMDGEETSSISVPDLSVGDRVVIKTIEDIHAESVLTAVQISVLPENEEEDEVISVSQ